LDGGGYGEVLLHEIAHQLSRKGQFGEIFHLVVFEGNQRATTDTGGKGADLLQQLSV
jgi:hypothetical protein